MKHNFFKLAAITVSAAFMAGCSKSDNSMADFIEEIMNANPVVLHMAPDGSAVFVNDKGEQTSGTETLSMNTLHSGLALAVKDTLGQLGYINAKGEFIIEPKFKSASDFHGGIAIAAEENGPLQVIDTKGKVKFQLPDNAYIAYLPNEGIISYTDICNRLYFVTTDGKQLLPNLEIYDNKYSFYNAKYLIYTADNDEPEIVKFSDGSPILQSITFDEIRLTPYSKDDFLVQCDSKWGAVNADGKFIINPRFEWISKDGDMFVAKTDDGKYCWIDMNGETVIKPKYKEVASFFSQSGGHAIVSTNDKSWTVINKKGESIFTKRFDEIKDAGNGYFFVKKDKNWGIVNSKGEFTAEPQFGSVEKVGKVLLARPSDNEGLYGVISVNGEYLTDRIYVYNANITEAVVSANSNKPDAESIANAAKNLASKLWIGQPISDIPFSVSQQSINDYTEYCDGMLCINDGDYYNGKVNMNIYATFENGGIKWTYRRGGYRPELVPTDKVNLYCVSIQTKGDYELGAEIYKILTEKLGYKLSGSKSDKIDVFTIQFAPDKDPELFVMDSANPIYEEDYE